VTSIVCDTGPLLAVLNDRDKLHKACVTFFDTFEGDLVVPSLIVTEVCYLAQTQAGPQAEARFLDSIVADEATIAHPTVRDWVRITPQTAEKKSLISWLTRSGSSWWTQWEASGSRSTRALGTSSWSGSARSWPR
jgi:predicted nucleic acid-binding protein